MKSFFSFSLYLQIQHPERCGMMVRTTAQGGCLHCLEGFISVWYDGRKKRLRGDNENWSRDDAVTSPSRCLYAKRASQEINASTKIPANGRWVHQRERCAHHCTDLKCFVASDSAWNTDLGSNLTQGCDNPGHSMGQNVSDFRNIALPATFCRPAISSTQKR